jgi:hypothetical protein
MMRVNKYVGFRAKTNPLPSSSKKEGDLPSLLSSYVKGKKLT